MPRWKLTLEYDGRPFVGWQTQATGVSVQSTLEAAITAFCGEEVRVQTCGRTDAGVHALGLVVHMDIDRPAEAHTVRGAINFHLKPAPIAVLEAVLVSDDFNARFSCIGREYEYRIIARPSPLTIDAGFAWNIRTPLDADAMNGAAQCLVGQHDFSSFRASQCQAKSPIKTLDRLTVTRTGDVIAIKAAARSFLHHQVRNMVGTLKLVGEGKWCAPDVARALAARDRTAAGPTAPPDGLFFVRAIYPDDAGALLPIASSEERGRSPNPEKSGR